MVKRLRNLWQFMEEIFAVEAEGPGDITPKELLNKDSAEKVVRRSCVTDGVAKKKFGAVSELFRQAVARKLGA